MSELRISSTAGPKLPATGLRPPGTFARPVSPPRWRDIQFVEFEGSEPALDTQPPPRPIGPTPVPAAGAARLRVPANTNVPFPPPSPAFPAEPDFPPAPAAAPPPRGPRYGRAIAPLPPHLIASVPPPLRVSPPPAPRKLRLAAPTLGK